MDTDGRHGRADVLHADMLMYGCIACGWMRCVWTRISIKKKKKKKDLLGQMRACGCIGVRMQVGCG